MSDRRGRQAATLLAPVLALLVAACSATGTANPSGGSTSSPTTEPSVTPDANTIEHPTGASDIVLRYEEGGGFMMAGFAATMVPHFTLYGDGAIVYRDPMQAFPEPVDGISRMPPLRTAKLSEAQIQDLLVLALGEGGLAVARPEYRYDMVADASTAIFTVRASGLTKNVSVYALGIEDPAMPDLAARQAFGMLANTLTSIEAGGAISATDYVPVAYRGVLFEAPGIVDPNARPWPWDDITPADFAPAVDPNGPQFPQRTMAVEEVEALGIDGYEGGLQNVVLTATDGTTYQFSLRPLLPDETE